MMWSFCPIGLSVALIWTIYDTSKLVPVGLKSPKIGRCNILSKTKTGVSSLIWTAENFYFQHLLQLVGFLLADPRALIFR